MSFPSGSSRFHVLRKLQPILFAAGLCAAAAGAGGCGDDILTAPADLAPYPDGWVINGHPFATVGQATVQQLDGKNMPVGWIVYLADEYNGCSAVMRNFPNTTYMYFKLPQVINDNAIFEVTKGNTVFAVGSDLYAAEPSGGQIQVFSHDPKGRTKGAYDVFFKTGDHMAGVFDSEFCE